jgi:hypothetical protein
MKLKFVGLSLAGLFLLTGIAFAGPYAPAAGQIGSTAIHMSDDAFIAWATGVDSMFEFFEFDCQTILD